ncbi:MAG: GIY-YIG nuclease family protein [Minisyncoccia bacterium]
MKYYVYMVRCADDSLYTGITTDIDRRIDEHNGVSKTKKGAKYTQHRRPVTLVYSAEYENRSQASIEESRIKKLNRKQKEDFLKKHS